MNYAIFKQWTLDRVEDLVSFGIPREEAEELVVSLEVGAIAAEATARSDRQFLIDFDRHGSVELARMRGKSKQAICERRTRILKKVKPELTAALTNTA